MMEKRKEEEEAEEAAAVAGQEKADVEDETAAAASASFPEDELQNALMSSLEGKKCPERNHEDNAATATMMSPPSLPSSPRVDEEEESELTDKGYTLTDDDVSDKGGAEKRIV